MKNNPYQPSEHDIQNTIISYLSMKKFYVERRNSGAIRQRDARGRNRLIRLSPVGTPDIICHRQGKTGVELYYIEVKKKGNKPSYLQEAKMKQLEEYGAKCLVAYSLDDVQKAGL